MKKKAKKPLKRKPTQLDRIEGNLAALRVDFGALNENTARESTDVLQALSQCNTTLARLADEVAFRKQADELNEDWNKEEAADINAALAKLSETVAELTAQVRMNTERMIPKPITINDCVVVNNYPRCAKRYLGSQCVANEGHEGLHISEAGWVWNDETGMANPPSKPKLLPTAP